MALFGKKTKEETTDTTPQGTAKAGDTTAVADVTSKKVRAAEPQKHTAGRNISAVLVRPRITEKAVMGIEKNRYTFEVAMHATKHDIRDAVKEIYNVTPVKIHTTVKRPRHYTSRLRGRSMMERGLKKAYIYLKEGDRIDF